MSLFGIPPRSISKSDLCLVLSKRRRLVADLKLVIFRNPGGTFFFWGCVSVSGYVSSGFLGSTVSALTKVMYLLGGGVVGAIIAVVFTTLRLAFTSYKYRLHWRIDVKCYGLRRGIFPSSHIRLISGCQHWVNDLRCQIQVSKHEVVDSTPTHPLRTKAFLLEKDQYVEVGYPNDFEGLEWGKRILPEGDYEVSWTSLSDDGTSRMTVCTQKCHLV